MILKLFIRKFISLYFGELEEKIYSQTKFPVKLIAKGAKGPDLLEIAYGTQNKIKEKIKLKTDSTIEIKAGWFYSATNLRNKNCRLIVESKLS